MIEQAIKTELEALTGLPVYPLLLPADVVEGITYQCVSDPPLEQGLCGLRLCVRVFRYASLFLMITRG